MKGKMDISVPRRDVLEKGTATLSQYSKNVNVIKDKG